MPSKSPAKKKPKLTDAERHKRFVEAAREAGASDNPDDFDSALKSVVPRLRSRARVAQSK